MNEGMMHDVSCVRCRKPWYQRAMDMATQWRAKPFDIAKQELLFRSGDRFSRNPTAGGDGSRKRLRKSTSARVATSFTRVCLCAPISYNDVCRDEAQPRRSYSYPRSSNFPASLPSPIHERAPPSARPSIEGRRVFRGKSLTDDVLMRKFVIAEEAMMQRKKRNQMEIIRKRSLSKRKKLGPSPLCRMVMAEESEHVNVR